MCCFGGRQKRKRAAAKNLVRTKTITTHTHDSSDCLRKRWKPRAHVNVAAPLEHGRGSSGAEKNQRLLLLHDRARFRTRRASASLHDASDAIAMRSQFEKQ